MPDEPSAGLEEPFAARVMGEFHAYLRTKDGEFTKIDFPGAVATKAFGINARGDIVGTYCPAEPPGCSLRATYARGFLLREGEFTMIDVPGVLGTDLSGINARGDIVGYAQVDPSHAVGFLLTEDRDDENDDDDDTRAER